MSKQLNGASGWTRRYRVADFDADDRAVFEAAVSQATDMLDQLRAAKSGLQLVHGMPAGLPKPPGLQ